MIQFDLESYSQLSFYKGSITNDKETRDFIITINRLEDKTKVEFYGVGYKFTEQERSDIIKAFNEINNKEVKESQQG